MSQCLSLEQSNQVVLTDEAGNGLSERVDGADRRRRVDHGGVRAEDELLDAEGLDAQLERAPAVRRGVEEHVPVERRADVDAARGESRSSWIGPPPARIANTTVTSGQRSWAPASQAKYARCIWLV